MDMTVLPGVLRCRSLRRTVTVRLGTNPAVPRDELPGGTTILFALAALRSAPQAGSQFHGLATAIHAISGLRKSSSGQSRLNGMSNVRNLIHSGKNLEMRVHFSLFLPPILTNIVRE
jgi:hypothetical protein